MPDWQQFDDPPGANTLGNVAKHCGGLKLPNLQKLGLGNITPIQGVDEIAYPVGLHGKAAEISHGKDTTTGHWEMAGLILERPFPIYPKGFPKEVIDSFIQQTACGGILCNKPASGTEVLDRLGEKHLETGWPIVYTSADSVFQVATNVEKIPLETLYDWCETARKILCAEHEVSRVIARPFTGKRRGEFRRLSEHRHDYAIKPRGETLLTFLQQQACKTVSVGKISDIFCNEGLDEAMEGKSNEACLKNITQRIRLESESNALLFANLVETDSHFGHRNDAAGFANAIQLIDREIGHWLSILRPEDLLILTADHGCDPTVQGTDHTREYVPIMAYSSGLSRVNKNIGTRSTFADTAASIADWFGLYGLWKSANRPGISFVRQQ